MFLQTIRNLPFQIFVYINSLRRHS